MVIFGKWREKPIIVSFKTTRLTISIGEPYDPNIATFDHEGRLWSTSFNRATYRRGLDGKIIAKWRLPEGGRARRWLSEEEGLDIEDHARRTLHGLYAAFQTGEADLNSPLPHDTEHVIQRVIAFDRAASMADAEKFHTVYKPVGILPPDQYMSVVLQATEGCAFNTCTFCDFYRDQRFHIKTPDEFRIHAAAVRDFLGAGLSLRRAVFLGAANALAAPMRRLTPLFEIARDMYEVAEAGGIYAFLDGFSGEKKSVKDYAKLKSLGLRRITVGLESGHAELLTFLKKPGKPDDAVKAVQAMKSAGVAVSIIILVGAGGQQFANGHTHDTIRAINAMPLDEEDLIYFSELMTYEGLPYAEDAHDARLNPLTSGERTAQIKRMRDGFRFNANAGEPHISRYDIREFIY